MAEGKNGYKIDVLRKMLEAEDGYGARLHMDGLPILTIDAEALRALIDHYEKNGRK